METLLSDTTFSRYLDFYLQEDLPSFDYGGYVVGDSIQEVIALINK